MSLHTNTRTSNDVDAEIELSRAIQPEDLKIDPVYFTDADGLDSILDFDANFAPTFGPLDPGYRERAIRLNSQHEIVSVYISECGRCSSVEVRTIFRTRP